MPLSITQRISARSRSRSAQLELFTSFVPPSRQLSLWNLRDRFAGFVVVRRVVAATPEKRSLRGIANQFEIFEIP